MHISRIRVPEFRVLKDIDISFEKEFVPRIFPLGSQNGGGKSTLLQLIFVLLHCSTDPERIPYLQNMLQGFKIPEGSDQRLLASIDIWDGEKTIRLDFLTYKDFYLQKILNSSFNFEEESYDKSSKFIFSISTKLDKLNKSIATVEKEINDLEKILDSLERIKKIDSERERDIRLREEIMEARSIIKTKFFYSASRRTSSVTVEELQEQVQGNLEVFKLNLEDYYEERENLKPISQQISEYFQSENLMYLCQYSGEQNKDEEVLVCHFSNLAPSKIKTFLETLSKKTFLAAPASQVFLFLSKTDRKLLFKGTKIDNNYTINKNYTSEVQEAKSKLSGFFTYDFVAVSLLTESFKTARDQDFAKAIETNGKYGNSFENLLKDLHLILGNKKVIPNENLSEIIFKLDTNDDNIELYPEDLSHGELKRLSIYIWLKYHNIEDAIVLMDEIEIAFHPDWQYQIISDIQEWAPNNQYILATHSYELCQALTPSHVKEIEPKLLKNFSNRMQ